MKADVLIFLLLTLINEWRDFLDAKCKLGDMQKLLREIILLALNSYRFAYFFMLDVY